MSIDLFPRAGEGFESVSADKVATRITVNGGPGSPKIFWDDETFICALCNFTDLSVQMKPPSWWFEVPPDAWRRTGAHPLGAVENGPQRGATHDLVLLAHTVYKELFNEDIPAAWEPDRFCISQNRSAPLHVDTGKNPMAWLFSFNHDTPGYLAFADYALRLDLENDDIVVFDPTSPHASGCESTVEHNGHHAETDARWRTNVTLFSNELGT